MEELNLESKKPKNANLEEIKERISEKRGFVFSICYRILGNDKKHIVEDVVSETIYGAIKNSGQFDEKKGSLEAWMTRIAIHKTMDYLRGLYKDRVHKKMLLDNFLHVEPKDLSLEERMIRSEIKKAVREAIELIRPEYKNVLNMELEGLTNSEIVERSGLPAGTVKSHLRRGKLELAEILESKKSLL